MATEVIMPKVDMVMVSGTFVQWLREEGEHVQKGEPLFVVMTEKAAIEIESPASGILAGVRAKPEEVISVAEVIAYILEPGESLSAAAIDVKQRFVAEMSREEPEVSGTPSFAQTDEKVRATPVARRLAAQLGVDMTEVPGRGPRGRIHKVDVLSFAEQMPGGAAPSTGEVPILDVRYPTARQKGVVRLAGPRRIIADRMAHSAFTAPHISLSLSVDLSEATRLRAHLLEAMEQRTGQRLSFTAIVARCVAWALPQHPYLNASVRGEEVVLWEDIHLGIATSIDDYLVVPVIREAQNKSLEQLVTELADLVERARTRRLSPSEMTGSTFTISNLGMFGIESFTAIINPPEAAILAMGKAVSMPVEAGGGIELRPMMNLTLSVDHRVVDGVAGARFLAELKAALENPYLLF